MPYDRASMFERALCVAAHPDDEVLGVGATMAALADRGCDVHALVLGEGVGARYTGDDRPDDEVAHLETELQAAGRILGVTMHQRDLPDQRFATRALLDVIHLVEAVKAELDPDVVFCHHAGDMNQDHQVVAQAVLTAFRPVPGARPVTILGFETLSSTEWNALPGAAPFVPNWFEDASPGLDRKVAAMAAYRSELREWPHPRSLEGIRVSARRWGMTVGLEAAEPFMLLRRVAG
jgi:LmbE family N-acetylglucosaminyl deacetylase